MPIAPTIAAATPPMMMPELVVEDATAVDDAVGAADDIVTAEPLMVWMMNSVD